METCCTLSLPAVRHFGSDPQTIVPPDQALSCDANKDPKKNLVSAVTPARDGEICSPSQART